MKEMLHASTETPRWLRFPGARMMRRALRAVLGPAILLAISGDALGQDLWSAPIGTRISRSATLAGRIAPLPPGEFELVSRAIDRSPIEKGGVWLMSTAAGKYDASVWFFTNRERASLWNMNDLCRIPAFFSFVEGQGGRPDFECWKVSARTFDQKASGAFLEFVKRSTAAGSPNVAPFVYMQIVSRREILEVEYDFAPSRWGLSDDPRVWSQNAWNPANVRKDPARARALQVLADQGKPLSDALKAGLAGRPSEFIWKLQ